MNRRQFLRTLAGGVAGGTALAVAPRGIRAAPGPADRPNILLLTADDMNGDSPGCYGSLVPEITPSIDALAAQGVRFANAHVNIAACQPSRSVLFTGRYPHRNGAMGFEDIRADVPLLTDGLRGAGYLNGILGKLTHLAPVERFQWDLAKDKELLGMGRSPARFAAEAQLFFDKARVAGRPFFLMANSHDPHRPFAGSQEEREKFGDESVGVPNPSRTYRGKDVSVPGFLPDLKLVRRDIAEYYSSVRRCDDFVGVMLSLLAKAGLADRTIVIFLSDNGMSFPFSKAGCYLHSTRVPWIVRWPGVTEARRVERSMISGIDLLPTLLEAAGVASPAGIDGRSFVPLLRGESQTGRERVFTEFHRTIMERDYPMRGVMGPRYGYIFNAWYGTGGFHSDTASTDTMKIMRAKAKKDPALAERLRFHRVRTPEELYDFEVDPDALYNLATQAEQAKRLEERREELRGWMARTEDPLAAQYGAFLGSLGAPAAEGG